MAGRNPQTMAKRAREQAMKEKRELKLAKKAARAEAKLNPDLPDEFEEGAEGEDENEDGDENETEDELSVEAESPDPT